MTKDDVIRLALEAGFPLLGPARTDAAMRFAALVMEEDAKLFDQPHKEYFGDEIQEAIRARKPA